MSRTFLIAAVFAIATAAQAGSPKRFDLVCNGSAVDSGKEKAFAFQSRLRMDTVSKHFCTDEFCGAFTKAEPAYFEYACSEGGDAPCDPGRTPVQGIASVSSDHFSFDWRTRKFDRTIDGRRSDPTGSAFRITYSGVCTFGAFSGLKK